MEEILDWSKMLAFTAFCFLFFLFLLLMNRDGDDGLEKWEYITEIQFSLENIGFLQRQHWQITRNCKLVYFNLFVSTHSFLSFWHAVSYRWSGECTSPDALSPQVSIWTNLMPQVSCIICWMDSGTAQRLTSAASWQIASEKQFLVTMCNLSLAIYLLICTLSGAEEIKR